MSGSRNSTGSEFQTDGPATEKARRHARKTATHSLSGNTGVVYLCCTGKEVKYERKKAPLKPDWQSSFDAHLYPGRTFEMIVMQRPEQKVGEVTVTAQALSEHCKSTNDIASVWVNTIRASETYSFITERNVM